MPNFKPSWSVKCRQAPLSWTAAVSNLEPLNPRKKPRPKCCASALSTASARTHSSPARNARTRNQGSSPPGLAVPRRAEAEAAETITIGATRRMRPMCRLSLDLNCFPNVFVNFRFTGLVLQTLLLSSSLHDPIGLPEFSV